MSDEDSNPPASPGASQPPLGTSTQADLDPEGRMNSELMDAANAEAAASQSVNEFADANPGIFAAADHNDEAAAASGPEAASTPAAAAAAAAIEAAANPAAAGGAGRIAPIDRADNDGAAPGSQTDGAHAGPPPPAPRLVGLAKNARGQTHSGNPHRSTQLSDTWARLTVNCGNDDETRQATAYASTGLDSNDGLLHHVALTVLRISEYPEHQANGWIIAETSSAIAQTTAGKVLDALFLEQPDAADIPSISGVAAASTWSADYAQYDLSSLRSFATWEEQTVAFLVDQTTRLVQTVIALFDPVPTGPVTAPANDQSAALSAVAKVLNNTHQERRQQLSANNAEVAVGTYMDPHMLKLTLERHDTQAAVAAGRSAYDKVIRARGPKPLALATACGILSANTATHYIITRKIKSAATFDSIDADSGTASDIAFLYEVHCYVTSEVRRIHQKLISRGPPIGQLTFVQFHDYVRKVSPQFFGTDLSNQLLGYTDSRNPIPIEGWTDVHRLIMALFEAIGVIYPSWFTTDRHLRASMGWHNSRALFSDLLRTAHHAVVDAGLRGAHMCMLTNYIRPVLSELHDTLGQHWGRVAGDIQADSDLLPILKSINPLFEVFNQGPVQDPRVRTIRALYDSLMSSFRQNRLPTRTTAATTGEAAAPDNGIIFEQLLKLHPVCPKVASNAVLLTINKTSADRFKYMGPDDKDAQGNQLTMCSHNLGYAAFPHTYKPCVKGADCPLIHGNDGNNTVTKLQEGGVVFTRNYISLIRMRFANQPVQIADRLAADGRAATKKRDQQQGGNRRDDRKRDRSRSRDRSRGNGNGGDRGGNRYSGGNQRSRADQTDRREGTSRQLGYPASHADDDGWGAASSPKTEDGWGQTTDNRDDDGWGGSAHKRTDTDRGQRERSQYRGQDNPSPRRDSKGKGKGKRG